MVRSATVAAIGMLVLGWPAAQAQTRIFTADQEACYGRVYDRAHLAKHPQQKVTSLHIWRSLGERREAENWQPNQREEAIKTFRESGNTLVSAYVTFRDRSGYFYNSLYCGPGETNRIICAIDCDGGSFSLEQSRENSVLLRNNGFVLIGGCGEEVEDSKTVFFSPGQDDKVFRLDRKSNATCVAESQKARPIRKGKPLRERFSPDEAFCFGRDYDRGHLAKHPQQKVATIRVGRLDPAKEKADRSDGEWWLNNVKLTVSLTARAGAPARTSRYACTPLDGSWECTLEKPEGASAACLQRNVHLVRTENEDILLVNRRSGLMIEQDCEALPKPQSDQYPRHEATASDDKIFRLTRMPVDACR
jgi:hypothetical protein